jgi:hypothetical protein
MSPALMKQASTESNESCHELEKIAHCNQNTIRTQAHKQTQEQILSQTRHITTRCHKNKCQKPIISELCAWQWVSQLIRRNQDRLHGEGALMKQATSIKEENH